MNPPIRGPSEGPMKGAAENTDMATPLWSTVHISAKLPPIKVIGAEKKIPSRNLQTNKVPMFWATAHGMIKMTARPKVEQ
ncbi:hypothetical protein WICPIJ_009136 [Wickerhamomyces pijperi]|uniref:Uncharacterized protein n=1 Tax=Wickerhamomyces pijperi TaxID=599730 RepID=A0A9P8TFD2_WICPI|nr:hypothetical protein WICPIJ_009136 [Wickerhamomyces pijperi]